MKNSYPRFYRRGRAENPVDLYKVEGPNATPLFLTSENQWDSSALFSNEKHLVGPNGVAVGRPVTQIGRHQLPKDCPDFKPRVNLKSLAGYPKFFERDGSARLYKVQRPGVQPVFWLSYFGWDLSANYRTEKALASDHIVKPISRRRADVLRRSGVA